MIKQLLVGRQVKITSSELFACEVGDVLTIADAKLITYFNKPAISVKFEKSDCWVVEDFWELLPLSIGRIKEPLELAPAHIVMMDPERVNIDEDTGIVTLK